MWLATRDNYISDPLSPLPGVSKQVIFTLQGKGQKYFPTESEWAVLGTFNENMEVPQL